MINSFHQLDIIIRFYYLPLHLILIEKVKYSKNSHLKTIQS